MGKVAPSHRESGQVAIISVMFFMILFSVVVVSFVQNVVSEQRQTTNNELSASALAAAESGVDDAKRIIAYCTANPTASGCASLYNPADTNCNSVMGNSTLMTNLGISVNADTNSQQATVNTDNKQYYTCMIINYLTDSYIGSVSSDGRSAIVPLKLVTYSSGVSAPAAAAGYFTINWHTNSAAGNGPMAGLDNAQTLPTVSVWKTGNNRPAVLRVELVTVPTGGFTLDAITDSARAVTLRPITGTTTGGNSISAGGSTAYNMNYWAPKTEPNTFSSVATVNPVMYVQCSSAGTYACSTRLTLNGNLDLINNNYYLRIQGIYNDADFQLTATGTGGQTLYFNGVQPSVDVTGRAIDAYRRLSSRIEARSNNDDYSWWPEYTLQSGNAICKDLTVDSDTGTDNCGY